VTSLKRQKRKLAGFLTSNSVSFKLGNRKRDSESGDVGYASYPTERLNDVLTSVNFKVTVINTLAI